MCASVWEEEPVVCGQLDKTNENWKPIWREYKQHPHFLQQFTSPITHQQKKRHFLPLTRITITRTGNILPCTKDWLVRLCCLYLALRILFFFFDMKKAWTAESRKKYCEKIKCQTIWGQLTTCQHYFQEVFLCVLYLINTSKKSISFLISWFLTYLCSFYKVIWDEQLF